MKKQYLLALATVAALSFTACGKKEAPAPAAPQPAVNTEEKVLNFYNWPDYIPATTLADFEKETGIKVNYQTFENNEVLYAKMVAGNSGYDLVVPGSVFLKTMIQGNLLHPLDKAKLSNYQNLDMDLMKKLDLVDPGNQHALPWAWGYTTVGINSKKVKKALGGAAMPANAWDLVFNPAYTKKLASCGIAYLDSPTEILPPALHYVGKNAYSENPEDHKLAGSMLAKVRKDVKYFSSTLIDDLASGKVCAVIGWGGDINIAKARAIENKNGNEIEALLPGTGALLFFDMLAIPKDAAHVQNAHAFINYFLRPEVSAALTNELHYATANKASLAKVAPETAQDKTVFLDADVLAKMVSPDALSNATRESMSKVYTQFKTGK